MASNERSEGFVADFEPGIIILLSNEYGSFFNLTLSSINREHPRPYWMASRLAVPNRRGEDFVR